MEGGRGDEYGHRGEVQMAGRLPGKDNVTNRGGGE